MHGGLSPELKNINQILDIPRPTDIPDSGNLILMLGLLCDLLWSDPDKTIGDFEDNDRGVSVVFGEKIVHEFNRRNDLDLVIRAHQVLK